MISQKQFILGCLVGGVFGASAALLLPTVTHGLNGLTRSLNKKQPRHRSQEAHSHNHEHVAAKHHASAPRKVRTKRPSSTRKTKGASKESS